ncbi:MAG: acetyl-CoA carboxylase biotin carboxyl carrier protein subunit [Bacteroidales bacterium]|nr:acetyl-CoA carboxylase biotin carboxyl carrier protein subunit [Bacteroidales bacterium]
MAKKGDDECAKKKVRCKTLVIDGGKYKTTLTKKYENRKKWEKPNKKHVNSFIPGTVNEIFVEEGKQVNKGDSILVLEAMKMLNMIVAPVSGKVKKINVKTGSIVPKGFLMLEFE